ncbi:MAG TPA: hypothetical protein VHS96_06495, partial [Bacteroidia bacterium]|nr:hypothetical protein [Bacteroidia bacterium]
ARADAKGEAITFINEDDMMRFGRIEKLIERELPKITLPGGFKDGPEYNPKAMGRGGRPGGGSSGGRGGFGKGRGGAPQGRGGQNRGGEGKGPHGHAHTHGRGSKPVVERDQTAPDTRSVQTPRPPKTTENAPSTPQVNSQQPGGEAPKKKKKNVRWRKKGGGGGNAGGGTPPASGGE